MKRHKEIGQAQRNGHVNREGLDVEGGTGGIDRVGALEQQELTSFTPRGRFRDRKRKLGAADRGSHTAALTGVLEQGNDAQVADRSDLGHECICSTREISNASVRRSVVTAAASW
jgi:hypothetical protein